MNLEQLSKSKFAGEIESQFGVAEKIRKSKDHPVDASLMSVLKTNNPDLTFDALMDDLGVEPHIDTIENMLTVQEHKGVKYIVPEIMRDAINLGLRKAPIYPNIIAAEEAIASLTVQIPHINMMEAGPKWVNENETIKTGGISYGSKSLTVRKMGRGIKFSDEFNQYTTLKIASLFLKDFGVKLGYALDGLAIDILLNGEQADGSESAPVIGVATTGTIVYRDLLKIWIRLSRMGKSATRMIAGENMALEILDMDEFKKKQTGTTDAKLNLKTPIPTSADLFIHGGIPEDQLVILDPNTTMIKYNARPLLIESERIVSNQTQATYATITTGFGIMYRDSRLVIDQDLDFDSAGFPEYMNVDLLESSELD